MKLTLGKGDHTIVCTLLVSRKLSVASDRYSVAADTAAYAVCRFLRHHPAFAGPFVRRSYNMRLASGAGRRPRRFLFTVPARYMELPGAWVTVGGAVAPEGVTVERIRLHETRRRPGGVRGGSSRRRRGEAAAQGPRS